ncbi:hypothetical protein BXZ70DRAFT_1007463 [Cristinia sonorae]|uniref:F-box domain-containing protein n=1 Tax=Cristinia sonorae TaxID=1940300 RepID=A0A8K0XRC2_9AGAR|nr:hypothetical protein BXZ70DRAFT_1007463 [Cristinia sonorae]
MHIASTTDMTSVEDYELPIELWEQIIDIIAEENRVPDLLNCSLVCREWVSRCRFHLCITAHLFSSADLSSFTGFISSSPLLPTRVRVMRVNSQSSLPAANSSLSWIAHIPLRLSKLPNLESLYLTNIDLERQHSSFWKSYTTFRGLSFLEVRYPRYSRWSQLTRLISASQSLQTRLVLSETLGPEIAHNGVGLGVFYLNASHLQQIRIDIPWKILAAVSSSWIFTIPSLYRIVINVTDISPAAMFPPEHRYVWGSVGAVFYAPSPRHPLLANVNMTFEDESVAVELVNYGDTERRKLTVRFNDELCSFAYIAGILSSLTSCDLKVIAIRRSDKREPSTSLNPFNEPWHLIDRTLFNSHHHLTELEVDLSQHSSEYFTQNKHCIINIYSILFPTSMTRGVLPQTCNPDVCWFHDSNGARDEDG